MTIDTLKNGEKSNRELLTLEGKVADDHLDKVKVHGKKATMKDGKYSARVLFKNGRIRSDSERCNRKLTTRKVDIDVHEAPDISELTPKTDVKLSSGESVKIHLKAGKS
ncbi:hypothetical protein [Bacillus stratosphericus]|uniref:hypothetical protein n=1 Tax=Bacillus stratosphericus TaxID=293386 RepID=UPI001CFA7287|nr:hypothetical protein [Bacillus stratosphericus]